MWYEELIKLPRDEITTELRKMDFYMMQQNHKGVYIKSPWMNGVEDKEEKDKAINIDIINLCVFGICAYNRKPNATTSLNLYNFILQNPDKYLENANIPVFMKNYYYDVFYNRKIDYLYNYLQNYNFETDRYEDNGQGKGITKVKATAAGRAFNTDREAAFASVLILPAMLALIYISVVVIYFVFFYGG